MDRPLVPINTEPAPCWRNYQAPEAIMSNDETEGRTLTPKIYVVEDAEGNAVGIYRATSTTQSKAFHTKDLSARLATVDEILAMGRTGAKIGGLKSDVDGEDDVPLF